jgi:hypothetical protein
MRTSAAAKQMLEQNKHQLLLVNAVCQRAGGWVGVVGSGSPTNISLNFSGDACCYGFVLRSYIFYIFIISLSAASIPQYFE